MENEINKTNIDLKRERVGDFYNALKSLNGQEFLNELHAYNRMTKLKKVNLKSFRAYLMIFEELKLITIENEDAFKITINECKTDLKNSKIYNFLNFYSSAMPRKTK